MRKPLLLLVAVLLVTSTAFAGDPPARVARVSYLSGEVSIQTGGVNDWVQANINRPLTSSDRLWADNDSRAELQMGGASLRVDNNTSMTLVNVSDNNVQVRVDQGTASLHVGELFDGDIYEIDTPNVAFIVRKKGDYRFDVDNAGDTTSVTVFRGEGDATGEGPMIRVKKEQRYTFTLGRSLQYTINNNPGLDGFDQWAIARAKLEDQSASARYVSRYAVGYSDLDDYGAWVTVSPYGPVWYPRVVAGWAPYRYGHWVWVSPWGWTWVDDAPWGFAPFHYGRWVYYGSRWGWCPGPYRGRPVYAPALVGWFGGGSWGVSVSFGIGGGVGWFPLGWGEPYIPYYGHSRGYFQHVNVTNTRITNITYVTNNYYGDHHGKSWNYRYGHDVHAVTAVSNDTFRLSRPTRGGFMHVSENDIKHARFENSVPVRPTTNSVLGPNAGEHRAAPPAEWKRPSRPERTTMTTNAAPSRPDRVTQRDPVGRDAVTASDHGNAAGGNGRPNRGYPRPGGTPTTAEVERPRGMPNAASAPAASESASGVPSRVPRPPSRGGREDGPQNNVRISRQDGVAAPESARVPAAEAPAASRPDREDRPQSYARPTRQDAVAAPQPTRVPAAEVPAARVPRPQAGEVVRPDRHQDPVSRDQAQPAPRTYENREVSRPQPQSQMRESRPEAVTRDVRPQSAPAQNRPSRVETPRPSEPSHAAPPPASKPAPERSPRVERKVEKENNASSVRYPRPYGTVKAASYNSFTTSSAPARTMSDYTERSRPSYGSHMSTTPRASYSSSSYSRPSYSQPRSSATGYSQPARSYAQTYSAPRASSGISHASGYSSASRSGSSYSRSSNSGHNSSHASSSGSSGRGGGSRNSHR